MTKLIMSIGLYMARMYSIINQVNELSSWSLKCRAIIQFPHDHSFWVTVAHGECEQVLQIIVCQCYLKLFARTRECFARLVVLASSTRIYYILKTPFLKGSPISSGGPASLDSPWNGERHRSFLITNLYDTTSLYGYDSKFHKWCLSREWHLSMIPLCTKLFFVCIPETQCTIWFG